MSKMNSKHFKVNLLSLVISGVLTGAAIPGIAVASDADSTQSAKENNDIEQIVVTARKRVEGIMKTPVAVTAVTGKSMDRMGATNLEQISANVPGLQLGRAAQTTNVFIRGLGSGINKSFEQSVGMYIDGIYMPRSRMYSQAFMDLQQVEILRGPQGILFGKNTVAGAIKVETYTPRPDDDLNGRFSLDYEPEQNTKRATLGVTLPVNDQWAARVAARYEKSDGYVENLIFNNDAERKENKLARITLAGYPTDSFSVVAKLSHTDMDGHGNETVVGVYDPAQGQGLPTSATVGAAFYGLVPGFAVADGASVGRYQSYVGNSRYGEDSEFTKSTVGSVKLEYIGDRYTLTGVTGYSNFNYGQWHDVDFGPINLIQDNDGEHLKQWSQEIRVMTDLNGPLNVVAGGYYEHQDLNIQTDLYLDGEIGGFAGASGAFGPFDSLFDAMLYPVIAGPGVLGCATSAAPATCQGMAFAAASALPNQLGRAPTFEQNGKTLALFAELSWDISDDVTLDLGARYTRENKDANKAVALFFGDDTDNVFITADGGQSGALDPLSSALLAGVWGSAFSTYPHDQDLAISEHHLDPSARLTYNYSDDTMLYMSYTEGYKSGGINFSPDTAKADGSAGPGTEYKPETVKSWEFGLRSTLMDDSLRFSLTAFNTELSDQQVTSFQGTNFVVTNAASSRSRGLELESQYIVSSLLNFGVTAAYLNNEYLSFTDAGCTIVQQAAAINAGMTGCTQDLTGRSSAFAPKWSGKFYIDGHYPLSDEWQLSARADVSYKGEHYIALDLDPSSLQSGYAKLDARIAFEHSSGLELALYGRNLTNKASYSFQVNNPLSAGAFSRWIEEPRVIGIQATYNF